MRIEVPVRWADLDAQGHVNNSVIVEYLQEARVRFISATANASLLGAGIVVVAHSVDYLAPVTTDTETVSVEIGVVSCSRVKIVVGYQVYQGATLVARAITELCVFDFDANLPRPLTEAEQAEFLAYPIETGVPAVGALGPGKAIFADAISPIHEYPLTVRWSEMDLYGHVNNLHFWVYIQEARIAATETFAPEMVRSGNSANRKAGDESTHNSVAVSSVGTAGSAAHVDDYYWLIVHQDLKYLKQLHYRLEPFEVRTAIVGIGRSSVKLAAEIIDPKTGELYARAFTVLVCADETLRPTALPESITARFS